MKLNRSWIAPLVVAFIALATGGWLLQSGAEGRDDAFRSAKLLEEVHRLVSERYVEEIDSSELYQMAIDGMLRELGDPHSDFLDPEEWQELRLSTTGDYGGLGIRIDKKEEWITVVGVLPNGPAEHAGLQTGDRIIQVDGQSARDWSTNRATTVLRGEKGSTVDLTIARVGVDEPLRFTLERDEIHVVAVKAFMLEDDVGYVKLDQFSRQARDELRDALSDLVDRGASSVVLDLQRNPGGLLEEGVAIADLFLPESTEVVSTRSRMQGGEETYLAPGDEAFPDLPLVVLAGGGSASASEIVAGALQDHDRALVLGTTTFGKGSVQSLFTLPDNNHLKLTTGRWYTPSGRSIQKPHGEQEQLADLASRAVSMGGEAVEVSADTAEREAYRTDGGRIVYGGGGITPDLRVIPDTLTTREQLFQSSTTRKGVSPAAAAFEFAVEWAVDHEVPDPGFEVTPEMREGFLEFLNEKMDGEIEPELYRDARGFVDYHLGIQIANAVFGEEARVQRQVLNRNPVTEEALALLSRVSDQEEVFARADARQQERERESAALAPAGEDSGSATGSRN